MLKKIFEKLEQPYRYITPDGAVHDKTPLERFRHRAEFKTAVAVVAGAIGLRLLFNDTAGLIDTLDIALSAPAGYMFIRRSLGRHEAGVTREIYGRDAVVDVKPKPFDQTSPEDLDATQKWFYTQTHGRTRNHTTIYGGFAAFAFMNAIDSVAYVPYDPHFLFAGFFVAALTAHTANGLANLDRTKKILDGTYVILAEKPEMQKEKNPIRSIERGTRPVLEGS